MSFVPPTATPCYPATVSSGIQTFYMQLPPVVIPLSGKLFTRQA